tara:strand:+ start:400 stop:2469 length:2070 start_codon:yes stop_codon:yes gene_type:complete
MKNKHNLLIVERSSSALTAVESDNKDYVLEGVFGQIDQKNRNNRIYTESEYVPQIEALQSKIASSKLLGELDHPTQFDTSLKNVSHIIEELFYDKDTKEVRGKIRLLDTEAGKQAKALVDAGVPLQISSRAAGAVESNGEVKIKQLFTYDLVADPGFENAELTRVNESYGYENDNSLYIYEMHKDIPTVVEKIENTNTQIKENQKMADFVKAEDFNKYSEYLANEIKSLKESMGDKTVSEDSDLENLKSHNNHIVENVKTLSEYVEHVAEMLDNSIQYTEHVAEKADQGISYSETLAEKLDESISYTEHVSEAVAKVKDFANYLAEAHNEGVDSKENLLEYVEYLKENLQAVSEYTEYIAESLNEEVEDVAVNAEAEEVEEEEIEAADAVEGEEVAKEVADEVEESEDPAKEADEADETEEIENIGDNSDEGDVEGEENGVEAEEVIASDVEDLEEIGDNAPEGDVEEEGDEVLPAEDIEDESVTSDSEIEDASTEVEAGEGEEEAEGEDGALDPLEAYKNEISSKLDKLVESATIKDNENPSFFRVVSSTTREKYNSLNESAKTNVRNTVSKRGFMTESEIVSLMTNSELILESAGSAPFFINKMPAEYATAWENLSEAKKNQITAQSQYHTLKTEYQVANFWQTRDLREAPVTMEKVAMVNEAKEETKTIGYDVTGYGEAFKKRFNK